MKKLVTLMAAILAATSLFAMPVFAADSSNFNYNYGFASGPDTNSTFGNPTPTDIAARNPEQENIRRNKDAAYNPPPYGVFSGEIPTDASSLFHDNTPPDYAANVTYVSEPGSLIAPGSSEVLFPTNQVLYYADGSIGTLSIPKLNLVVKVFEGETLDNLRVGVGHFTFTSVWTGNVGIAGHNRGASDYLRGIWNLNNGDEIIYTTKYGTRIYSVISKEKIADTDYSKLGWSATNTITLITCASGEPSLRWCICAAEK